MREAEVTVADYLIKHNICEGKKPDTTAGC